MVRPASRPARKSPPLRGPQGDPAGARADRHVPPRHPVVRHAAEAAGERAVARGRRGARGRSRYRDQRPRGARRQPAVRRLSEHRRPRRRVPSHRGRLGGHPDYQRVLRLAPVRQFAQAARVLHPAARQGGGARRQPAAQYRAHGHGRNRPQGPGHPARHRTLDERQRGKHSRHRAHPARHPGVGRIHAPAEHPLPARLRLAEGRQADRGRRGGRRSPRAPAGRRRGASARSASI